MAIDPEVIGRVLPSHSAEAEPGRLRFFAQAIGETDPVYTDVEAAKAAGHHGLPVPPTFLFCLLAEKPDPLALLDELGIDVRRILHGEQGFTYHAMAYAGDTLTFTSTVTDAYSKKGGVLDFLVQRTDVTRNGELIAELHNSLVVRNPEAAK
ncbi:MaoC family dehydratase N-terminal domain-containing protein [Streptomyces pristinaespiralis]|uniref:Acyl dehydratase n=2 Tax=Streptomyces pristinaespiralis TaxID=38300 RepID=B5H6T0_STRE2|nr:MaoC family dehydratase N-terminal domain-containing protein [Streptomyces pristinaespiralis]ALC18709.1 acyl dehydratase [Streptomyces pristinaespiralis]EDY62541.1 acyl dehydratase [Streptomyces pristinaespiralis ATCC 25486]QMU18128.1 MaoC family dehydratase N-terminal domain-containing protein [Streptomyces pristinaespiralis]